MAYISQEMKKELAPQIKAVLKKYGVKGTIGIDNHSCLVVNLSEGELDFIGAANEHNREYAERTGQQFYEVKGYYQANPYRADEDKGIIGKFFGELIGAMKGNKWYDRSDAMTDYFDTAYYLNINVGRWNKDYKLICK